MLIPIGDQAGTVMAPLTLILMTMMVYRNMRLIIDIKEHLKAAYPTQQCVYQTHPLPPL